MKCSPTIFEQGMAGASTATESSKEKKPSWDIVGLKAKDKAFLLLRIKKFGDRHKIAFSAQENKWNQEYHSRTRIRRFHFQERLDILPVFAVTKSFEITADVRGQMPIPTIYAEKDGSKKELGSVSGNKEQ